MLPKCVPNSLTVNPNMVRTGTGDPWALILTTSPSSAGYGRITTFAFTRAGALVEPVPLHVSSNGSVHAQTAHIWVMSPLLMSHARAVLLL